MADKLTVCHSVQLIDNQSIILQPHSRIIFLKTYSTLEPNDKLNSNTIWIRIIVTFPRKERHGLPSVLMKKGTPWARQKVTGSHVPLFIAGTLNPCVVISSQVQDPSGDLLPLKGRNLNCNLDGFLMVRCSLHWKCPWLSNGFQFWGCLSLPIVQLCQWKILAIQLWNMKPCFLQLFGFLNFFPPLLSADSDFKKKCSIWSGFFFL